MLARGEGGGGRKMGRAGEGGRAERLKIRLHYN